MKYTIERDLDPHYANDVPTLDYTCRDGVTSFNGCPCDVGGLLDLIPVEVWTRGKRVPFLRKVYAALGDDREAFKPGFSDRHSWRDILRMVSVDHAVLLLELLEDVIGSEPEGWRDAKRWFRVMESVLCAGGVDATFHNGAEYLLLTVATPEFLKTIGATADEALHDGARKLHKQYMDGDVWGVTTEYGESCWGFYGDDHEASGLMDFVRENLPKCWSCDGKRHDYDVDGITLERCDKCGELSYPYSKGDSKRFHEIVYAYPTSTLHRKMGKHHIVETQGKMQGFDTYQESLAYAKSLGTLPLRWSRDHPANAKYLNTTTL